MNLSVGIVGFPNVGKSTLFNALLKKQVADSANYPFTTIEPNVGVVEVPDLRLGVLKDLVEKSEGLRPEFKIIPTVIKFVDIAGLVKGASQGEGLGNQFLSHIREVDVIVFILRDFENADVVLSGSENPKEDVEVLKSELLLKDLEVVTKRMDILSGELRSAGATDPRHKVMSGLEIAKNFIEQGKWLADVMDAEDLDRIKEISLLSAKKALYVLNSSEEELNKPEQLENEIRLSVKLEQELADLDDVEQKEYLKELGQAESGLNILIRKAYETLGLITFFTAGPKEVRAWTTYKGVLAPKAAGVIHTDFERGFIAAEVVNFQELVDAGSWKEAKAKGLVKTIGKTEEVKDGMVVEFRFSV